MSSISLSLTVGQATHTCWLIMQKFYWPSRGQSECKDESKYSRNGYKQSLASESWRCFNNMKSPNQNHWRGSEDYSETTSTYPPLNLARNATHLGVKVNNIKCGVRVKTTECAVKVNTTKCGVKANTTKCAVKVNTNPPQTTVVRLGGGHSDSCNRSVSVTHCTVTGGDRENVTHCAETGGEIFSFPDKGQRWNKKHKTWNENTLVQAEYVCGIGRERGADKRQSVQNFNFFNHTYENVYVNNNIVTAAAEDLKDLNLTQSKNTNKNVTKLQGSIRQTPRYRKRSKAPSAVFQSKSCDRGGVGAALLDNLSCMGRSGRTSPAGSMAEEQDLPKDPCSPAQSLAHRLRGRLEYVNKKMNLIRSRSAERLRGCTSAVRSEVIAVDKTRTRPVEAGTACVYSGPVLGQARAVVDCAPSSYDRDALTFRKDDLIDIIAMDAGGLWRGRCGHMVGYFKFVNVEILPTRSRRRSRNRSLRRIKRNRGSVAEVMRVLNMKEHLPVFVLNGYEDLTPFKDLDDEELDYLGISDQKQRDKLIAIAELLSTYSAADDDDGESDDDSSESGVADVNSDASVSSHNS